MQVDIYIQIYIIQESNSIVVSFLDMYLELQYSTTSPKLNTELLQTLMGNNDLQQTIDSNDLNKCVEDLANFTVVVMNKFVPEKKLRVRQHSSSWARESEVQEARFQWNLAHSKALKYNTLAAWHKYNKLRNKATALLRSGKYS